MLMDKQRTNKYFLCGLTKFCFSQRKDSTAFKANFQFYLSRCISFSLTCLIKSRTRMQLPYEPTFLLKEWQKKFMRDVPENFICEQIILEINTMENTNQSSSSSPSDTPKEDHPPCCPPGSHGAAKITESEANELKGKVYPIPGKGGHTVYVTGTGKFLDILYHSLWCHLPLAA